MLYGVSTDLYTHPVLELLEHGDVRNTLSLLAVNTLVLVGRLFERIPKGVTNSAYASLKWIGLLALPECGHQFRKEIEHSLSSLRENSPALTAHFAVKAIRIGLSLYFIAVGVTAAVSALFSYTQIEIALYGALGRFGGLSILVTVVDVVWTALRVQRLIDTFEIPSEKIDWSETIASLRNRSLRGIAGELCATLDDRTLTSITALDDKQPPKKLRNTLLKSLKTQLSEQTLDKSQIITNYALIFLCRLYPGGVVEALANFTANLRFTCSLIAIRLEQIAQRRSLGSKARGQ